MQILFLSSFRKEFANPQTGEFYKMNEVITRPEFADTLRKIGQDPDTFYTGQMADSIASEIQNLGGIITKSDLANYK